MVHSASSPRQEADVRQTVSGVGFRSGAATREGSGQRQLWTSADVRRRKL